MDETIPRHFDSSDSPGSRRPVDDARQIRMVRLACAGVVILLVGALELQRPYLTAECSRLEPWKVVELWCVDILALWWFIKFAVVHAVWGQPLRPVPFTDRKHQIRVVAFTGVSVLLLDLGFTSHLMYDESVRYGHGVATQGQVVSVRKDERELESWYETDCRFTDAAGVEHLVHVRVEAKGHEFPAGLPPETIEALTAKEPAGKALRVRYDPQFPARAWADGTGWDDGQKIYWFALLTLFFQAIVTALVLLFLVKSSTGSSLPWWWDIYKVLPLCVGAFWLFLMGLIDRLIESLS